MTFLPLQDWLNRKKQKKVKKGLRRVSKKHAKELAEYLVRAKAYKKAHPICLVCGSAPTQDVHHMAGRGPNLNKEETWLPTCRICHDDIHSNPSWARKWGYLK